jgi:hypothetical protein
LAEVLADPTALDRLPSDALIGLRQRARHLIVDLDAAISRHAMLIRQPRQQQAEQDRLLSPKEAAALYGVNARWLLDHADEIPGVRRLSRKLIRFSERALRRHLNGVNA